MAIPLLIKTIVVGPIQTNCYLLIDSRSKKCLVIDPGDEAEKIIGEIRKDKLIPTGIINTHGHYDHIGANSALKKQFNIPISIHKLDTDCLVNPKKNLSGFVGISEKSPPADKLLEEGDIIDFEGNQLKVIHTPGHTKGGICLIGDGFVFTGDTLFCEFVGRTDLPDGDEETLKKSLEKLKKLPSEYKIYPGHDNQCTIGGELEHNPYFKS